MKLEGDRKPASKCVHLGFLEIKCVHLRSPGVSRAQMRSPAFTWVEEMQMRSGVVRDDIGGGKWQMAVNISYT